MKKTTWIFAAVCAVCAAMLTVAVITLLKAPQPLPSVTYLPQTVSVAEKDKLDINTATAQQLEALPGIGPALAANIVAHRENIGGFTQLEQLTEVDGIGEAKLRAMEPYLKMIDRVQ